MKVVILAGGRGTRISEESQFRPKPMVEIGDMPILWHIMKIYSFYGHNEFIICCGYKGYMIKEFFSEYYLRNSDITFDFSRNGDICIHQNVSEPWKVTLVDTGLNTMTSGRIHQIKKYVSTEDNFLMTYGDGVSDVNINEVVSTHIARDAMVTMTVVQPSGRYGAVQVRESDALVTSFIEKPIGDNGWINGGFFVLNSSVFNFLNDYSEPFEGKPLEEIAQAKGLYAYKHRGYWQSMDSLREKTILEDLWEKGNAPWKVW